MDRRTLLRVTALLGAVPSRTAAEPAATGLDHTQDARPGVTGRGSPLAGFAYDGTAVVSTGRRRDGVSAPGDDDATREQQGYGEHGYGGAVP